MIKTQPPHKMGRVTFGKNKKREKEQTENMVKTPLVQTTSSSVQTKPDVSLGEKCNLTTFTKQSVLLNAAAGGRYTHIVDVFQHLAGLWHVGGVGHRDEHRCPCPS